MYSPTLLHCPTELASFFKMLLLSVGLLKIKDRKIVISEEVSKI
jgi:hypothetical protein